jgi:hypothetical protein
MFTAVVSHSEDLHSLAAAEEVRDAASSSTPNSQHPTPKEGG